MDVREPLQTIELETAPAPAWSVLWLHGLGADGHDFAPIVPELVRAGLAGAPLRVSARAGARGDDQRRRAACAPGTTSASQSRHTAPTRPACAQSIAEVDALIAREARPRRAAGAGAAGRFLAGRRDRAGRGLRRRQPVAGIVALSAYLPLASSRREPR